MPACSPERPNPLPDCSPKEPGETIDDGLRDALRRHAGRTALIDASGAWTYDALGETVDRLSQALAAHGVGPGDRIVIVTENSRSSVASFFAAIRLGAWPVLLNPRLAAPEIDGIIAHSGAALVVFNPEFSAAAQSHAVRRGAAFGALTGYAQFGVERRVGSLDEPTEPGVAALVYTSGSTGRPKGVMLTHTGLLFVARSANRIRALAPEDRMLGLLPISHIVGLCVVILGSLLAGASIRLMARFNPGETLALLQTGEISVLLGTPAMYGMLAEYCGRKGTPVLRAPGLRIISASGAPLDAGLKSRVETLFGLPLHNGYGITECSPTIAQVRPGAEPGDCSVGPPLPGLDIRLVDPDGGTGDGDAGELWVRGPNVMRGYFRDAEATRAVLTPDGWYRTGDLARLDNGNLHIIGRAKDLIIRFGFNVYPAEIEAAIDTHPGVLHSAVLGQPGDGGSEDIVAFVAVRPGFSVSESDLQEHLGARLAPYKQPSQIRLSEALPLTPSGKVAKRELAAQITGQQFPATT